MLKDAAPGRARGSFLAMSVGQLLEMLPWMVDMREGPVLVDALETVWKLSKTKRLGFFKKRPSYLRHSRGKKPFVLGSKLP